MIVYSLEAKFRHFFTTFIIAMVTNKADKTIITEGSTRNSRIED